MGNLIGGKKPFFPDSEASTGAQTPQEPPPNPNRKSFWQKRKTGHTPASPINAPNPKTAVFGVTFKASLERSPDYNTTAESKLIPIVVRKCCEFLNAKGLEEEGVYRIPGNRKNIDTFIDKFNSGK